MNKKTHKVIDIVLIDEENYICFVGSFDECQQWKDEQGFGYLVVPLTEKEKEYYN